MDQTAYNYLSRERLKNIDMLELLRLPGAETVCAGPDGALLRYNDLFQFSAEPPAREKLLSVFLGAADSFSGGGVMLVAHDGASAETLRTRHGFSTVMDCLNCVYDRSEPVCYTLPEGAEIRRLSMEHLDFVHAHYRTVDDIGYIRERIEEGMLGAFVGGEPAGFIGTHEERSIGLLEILPAYRQHGLAFALEGSMINRLLACGRLPFCQVKKQNEPSIALQRKLGFTFADDMIHWLVRES